MNTPLHSGLSSSLQGNLHSEPVFGFLPSDLTGLKLWNRFNSGITVTGSGVSQWDDVSGNGNHLLQATDTNRPPREADGSILFDGVDNFLKAAPFTLAQPETIYLLLNLVTEVNGDFICDGNAANTGGIRELTSGTSIALLAPTQVLGTSTPIYGSYSVITAVFNGAASFVGINNEAGDTLNPGTNSMSGFTLGAGATPSGYSNIQAKECVVFSGAHDAATRAQMINYLAGVGGLSI